MKILVTGANGFIGSHCLPKLIAAGFEVHGITRAREWPEESINKNIFFHSVDLFNQVEVTSLIKKLRPTHLLHCAWLTTPGIFWSSADNILWLQATIHLLQQFGENGGLRAMGLGSCAEYDWTLDGGICEEQGTPLIPKTVYGQCKLAAAQSFQAVAQIYNFTALWARIFSPYGVGEPAEKFISTVIKGLLQQKQVLCTHGLQIRDFLYIDDVVDAIVALLLSTGSGAYNIGSGSGISLKRVVKTITDELGHEELIQFGARPEQLGEPIVLVAHTKRLTELTNFQPKYDLKLGITKMIELLCQRESIFKNK